MTHDPTMDYFEKYRSKKKEMANLGSEISDLRNLIDRKKTEANSLAVEIRSMRRIITTMIDEGMDPVEVKMRNDLSDLTQSLWDYEDDTIQTLTISGATGATGSMTSMTGMIGASVLPSYPPYSSSTLTASVYPTMSVTSAGLPNSYSATNIHKSTST